MGRFVIGLSSKKCDHIERNMGYTYQQKLHSSPNADMIKKSVNRDMLRVKTPTNVLQSMHYDYV